MSTSLTLFQGTFVRLPQCIMGYLKDWIHVLYYLCYLECMQNAQAYCSSVNVYTCWTKLKYNLLHLLVWLRKNQTSISSLTEIKLHVSVPIFKLNLVKLFFFFFLCHGRQDLLKLNDFLTIGETSAHTLYLTWILNDGTISVDIYVHFLYDVCKLLEIAYNILMKGCTQELI